MKTKFKLFVNEDKDEDILNLIDYLENKKEIIDDEFKKSGREVGPFFEFEMTDDNNVNINYGFTDYEEGEDNTLLISIEDKIKVNRVSGGHSVMTGDYNDNDNIDFNNITELIKWLEEEINL